MKLWERLIENKLVHKINTSGNEFGFIIYAKKIYHGSKFLT